MKMMSELDNNYKRAFIKYVEVLLPQQLRIIEEHTRAMEQLANAMHLMPTSIRIRP